MCDDAGGEEAARVAGYWSITGLACAPLPPLGGGAASPLSGSLRGQ